MVLDISTINVYVKKLHLAILLRSVMPSSGMSKFLYNFWWLYSALDNFTINSDQIYLHKTRLLRNMIPKSGVRQLHYKKLWKIAAFSYSTKKYDAYKWHL